ncbi:MAG: hypothetical protein IIA59_12430 [Candidatus Marinimicrobia bacterium]|nr:hypothetical protein [Candidatus Neomarinimicrobiota bacterium]
MHSSKISGLSLLGAISVMACDALEPGDVPQALTQAALSYLISSDPVFTFDGLQDDQYQEEDAGSGLPSFVPPGALHKAMVDTLWPGNYDRLRTRRRITDVQLSFTVDSINDDTAYVTITHSLTGNFTVAGFNDSAGVWVLVDSISKSFSLSTNRRARFIAGGSATDSSEGWRLDALTALTGMAGAKIDVGGITVTDSLGIVLSLTGFDPVDHFFNRDNLPTFKAHQNFDLFVSVVRTGPEFPVGPGEIVGVYRGGRHGTTRYAVRRNLHDRGVAPDEVAGDNIYSRTLTVGPYTANIRPFRMFIDVVDVNSMLVASEEFAMGFIGIPYRISE